MTGKGSVKHQRSLVGCDIELGIDSLTSTGDGLGRVNDRVVFVPYTMPGDQVRVRVVQDKRTFMTAKLLEITNSSADRIEPECRYFTECGGCDWQHIPYAMQLDVKHRQLRESLQRIGGLTDPNLAPIIPSANSFGYRNRIQGILRDGAFHYMRKSSNKPIAVTECKLADQRINRRLAQGFEGNLNGKVELAVAGDSALVSPLNEKHATELGFRQVNSQIGEVLTMLIQQTLENDRYEHINDLYCGRGDWANSMATLNPAAAVSGVDSLAENIAHARQQASQLGLSNVRYVLARVEEAIAQITLKNSFSIVDPPRAGLDPEVCKALCRKPARTLVYVSCHAATLARDLKILTAGGYQIEQVQPLDMFPQTSHLESLVRLSAPVRK